MYTLLHYAVKNTNLECVKILMKNNADITLTDYVSQHLSYISTVLHKSFTRQNFNRFVTIHY